MTLSIILSVLGLIFLLGGAKLLVFGASQLATSLGISSLVVGLTVVAFGTSAPEIGVSIAGAWKGEGGLVFGNIVGSNIFNILLVLGLCSTITPLIVHRQLIWWDVPLMIAATLLFWGLSFYQKIGRGAGAILFASILLYLIITFRWLKRHPPEKEDHIPIHPIWLQCIWIVLGLGLLALGSDLLVIHVTNLAHSLGVSELLIGLTVVAMGTSLPELVTSLVALSKGKNDLAVGNVIGSNIFNLLAVAGIAGLTTPHPLSIPDKAVAFDIPILVGVSIAALPIFLTGHKISRWEGGLFLFYYALYFLFQFLEATQMPYLSFFTAATLFFIIPLTILTICVGIVRHFQNR